MKKKIDPSYDGGSISEKQCVRELTAYWPAIALLFRTTPLQASTVVFTDRVNDEFSTTALATDAYFSSFVCFLPDCTILELMPEVNGGKDCLYSFMISGDDIVSPDHKLPP